MSRFHWKLPWIILVSRCPQRMNFNAISAIIIITAMLLSLCRLHDWDMTSFRVAFACSSSVYVSFTHALYMSSSYKSSMLS